MSGIGNRRSACDRCRRHKLRCESNTDAAQCMRCIRARAECATGAARKSGRPIQLHVSAQPYQPWPDAHGPWRSFASNDELCQLGFPTPPLTEPHNAAEQGVAGYGGDPEPPASAGASEHNSEGANARVGSSPIDGGLVSPETWPDEGLYPADRRGECTRKLGLLHVQVLIDLDTVMLCKTAEHCTVTNSPDSNFMVGRMLEQSATLIELLEAFELGSRSGGSPHYSRMPSDIPTTLSLLSCYVSLVRIYRTIFSSILDSMPVLMSLPPPGPQLFPGMTMAGFRLEGRLDLQIQMLVQVCEDMLYKMESRIGIPENYAGQATSGLSKAAQMACLMLGEEAQEQPPLHKPRGSCDSLPDILEKLKIVVRGERRKHP